MNQPETPPRENFEGPPLAPLAFRVGVVGHRPHRLAYAELHILEEVLSEVLSAVRDTVLRVAEQNPGLYAAHDPTLRAISPLAEGADRLFAEQALDLEFDLCCVMPFPQANFEEDFERPNAMEDDSLRRFRSLLKLAKYDERLTKFELDGDRNHASSAYAIAGRVVLNQSDLLVVIWDGEQTNRLGGTEQTFKEARLLGVPVVWIDAYSPHTWRIVDSARPLPIPDPRDRQIPNPPDDNGTIRATVSSLLLLPSIDSSDRKRRSRVDDYYSERKPDRNVALLWTLLQDVLGKLRRPRLSMRVKDFEDAVIDEWPSSDTSPIGEVVNHLRPYYAWPDKLATFYADHYRSAFVFSFLLAALAVGLALLPLGAGLAPHGWAETLCIAGELLAILTILAMVYFGRRGRWHSRWIDYRLTAELVRHLRMVAPLGGGRPFPQLPAQLGKYGQPGATWMAWYTRAIERDLGLPSVVVDRHHLQACLKHLSECVNGQIGWHAANATSSHRIEHTLHLSGLVLLALTLVSCVLHLLPALFHSVHLPGWLPPNVLTFLCAVFPALGAALAGINNQAEFRRIAKRSAAMADQLKPVRNQIDELHKQIAGAPESSSEQFSLRASAVTSELARLLVNEVLDWRVVFLDRPLDPPA